MFHIRRMGCYSEHDMNFKIDRPNGYDCCLLLFIKTRARIVFNKYSPHRYSAYEGNYVDHWIQAELSEEIYSDMKHESNI